MIWIWQYSVWIRGKVSLFRDIEDYLNAREIPFDLIEIHLWQKGEFIDISPLMLNVGMTDYRPEDLNIYLRMLRRDYVFYREETDYIRNFKKLNNIL